jgi:CheY-like chemotaxis protein
MAASKLAQPDLGRPDRDRPDRDRLHHLFVVNVEHELRTPLSVAQGYAELLNAGDFGGLNTNQQMATRLIVGRLHGMSRLIDRIITLLAVEAGMGLVAPVSVTILLDAALDRYWPLAEEQGQHLEVHLADNLPDLLGDVHHLHQALDCLLENAVRFTPRGGHIRVEATSADRAVRVTVADTGRGIPPEQQELLFSGFYQIDMSSTRQYGGLGLGLTIAKAVIEAHGGQLTVHSAVGQGTTFTATLPVQAEVPSAALAARYATEAANPQRLRRILIVDDDPGVLFAFESALEQLPNCEIETATGGAQALQRLAEKEFDLLITDYRMPDMDGLALAMRLRQTYTTLAILMITAFSTQEMRHQAEDLRIGRVLDKPVDMSEIRDAAQAALAAGEGV